MSHLTVELFLGENYRYFVTDKNRVSQLDKERTNHRYRKIPELLYRSVKWRCQPWSSNWGIWLFVAHTRRNKCKQSVSTIFVCRMVFHTCLSSCSNRSTYAPDKSRLFWSQEKPRIPPIWAPCWNQDCTGSGISSLFCGINRLYSHCGHFEIKLRFGWQSVETVRTKAALQILHQYTMPVAVAPNHPSLSFIPKWQQCDLGGGSNWHGIRIWACFFTKFGIVIRGFSSETKEFN